MLKRFCAFLAALALVLGVCLPALPAVGLATAAHAIPVRDAGDQYFGSQLTADKELGAESRAFYDALLAMYDGGRAGSALLRGADQPVALTDAQVQAYRSGQSNLGHALTNARDAFYLDYPDLFYVNFNNFALRLNGDGKVCITPGTRGIGYLLDGITEDKVPALVKDYDEKLAELIKAGEDAAQDGAAAQVRAVHDKLTGMLTYTLDNEVSSEENTKYIRTAYGIVTGEGVCEAYSRAFKSAMDSLKIPCVLVEGVFRHSAAHIEAHMWDLVQVEGVWYGVDVTMDDPDPADEDPLVDAYGKPTDKVAYDDYLLAGDVTMGAQHAASTTLSAASYEFAYPQLAQNDRDMVTMHDAGGLLVRLDTTAEDLKHEGGDGSGTFYVSYNGMSYTEAAKHGYYILAHFMSVDADAHYDSGTLIPGTGEWSENEDWSYLAPDLYEGLSDGTTETKLPMPHVRYVQFAVTDVPPGDYRSLKGRTDLSTEELIEAIYNTTHYQGDPALLLAKTEVLENSGGTYQAPPYIKQAWPSQQSTMLIGQKYDIRVQLDEALVLEPGAQLGYNLTTYAFLNGKKEDYTAEKYCTVGTPSLSEDGKEITFTFEPSKQWAHDTIFYQFDFTGVVGKTSGKKPNSLVYLASHPCSAYAYQSQGFDWNLYGKPQLMDDFAGSDIKTDGWTVRDASSETGERTIPPEDIKNLKHRMTLVVTEPSQAQTETMEGMAEDKIKDEAGVTPLKTETYSINLTVCKSQIVSTGQAVRVMLGFPEGYGPDDAGVTFKAYHYHVDALGNLTGEFEEIPCIVTPQGLLVLCSSFSPFSVSALPAPAPGAGEEPQSRDLVVSTSCGGGTVTVNGDGVKDGKAPGVYTLAPGHGCTVTVEPPQGQQVSTVTVGGSRVYTYAAGNSGTVEITLTEEQAQAFLNGIIEVQFAPEAWFTNHAPEPEPELLKVEVSLPQDASVTVGGTLELKAETKVGDVVIQKDAEPDGDANARREPSPYSCTYQWYKGGTALAGQTGSTLTIQNAGAGDEGKYTVTVAVTARATGTTAASTATSGECLVKVNAAPATPKPADPAPDKKEDKDKGSAAPAPTPAPAAPAAPAPTAAPTAKPAAGKTGGTVLPPATATPMPATPAPALTNTPAPQPTLEPEPLPPADAQPQATAAPTEAAPQKKGVSPLVIGGLVVTGAALAGGLAWLFLPRKKHYK